MKRKPDSKTSRELRKQKLDDAHKRDAPEDLGKRTVQGVLIDESKWEGHEL